MQIVDLDHTRLVDHRLADLLRVEILRRGLQEDARRGLHQRGAGADHQARDQQGDDRVGALEARREDRPGGDRRADEAEQVGHHVLEAALDVEARAVGARERQRGGQVDRRPGKRDREDQPGTDVGRIEQPLDRLVGDESGQHQQRDAVRLR